MDLSHHPSRRLCEEYRIGDIAPGMALAVAVHATACDFCALLLREPRATPETLWRCETEGRKPLGSHLPPLLRDIARARWRKISPGVSVSFLRGVSGLGEAACLLRSAPGADIVLPSQVELILGLSGRASAHCGVLGSGDLIEITRSIRGTADPLLGLLALIIGDDGLDRGFSGPFA